MPHVLNRWAVLGAAVLAAPALLAACDLDVTVTDDDATSTPNAAPATPEAASPSTSPTANPSPAASPPAAPPPSPTTGQGDDSADSIDALPLPQRLAFMTGHVEAGLALYRAGEPGMAAPHLLHPVSETHAAEREGLDALGFDAAVFEQVSQALEEGRPAEEIEPQLAQAEANLAMLAERAGGEPAEIVRYLMDVIAEEYTIAITDGAVSDAGEYQDAYGFAIVARDRATAMTDPSRYAVLAEIETLIGLWPDGAPIPPDNPAPVAQVIAQTSRVLLMIR